MEFTINPAQASLSTAHLNRLCYTSSPNLGIVRQKEKNVLQGQSLKNWKPELDDLAIKTKKLRGSLEHPAIYSPAFSLVKASIEFAQIAVSDSTDLDNLYKALKKVNRALSKSNTVLNREEYS